MSDISTKNGYIMLEKITSTIFTADLPNFSN